jgi:hypothetical protein
MSKSLDDQLKTLERDVKSPARLEWMKRGDTFDVFDQSTPWNQLPNLLAQIGFNRAVPCTGEELVFAQQATMTAFGAGYRGETLRKIVAKSLGEKHYERVAEQVELTSKTLEDAERTALKLRTFSRVGQAADVTASMLPPTEQTTSREQPIRLSEPELDLVIDKAASDLQEIMVAEGELDASLMNGLNPPSRDLMLEAEDLAAQCPQEVEVQLAGTPPPEFRVDPEFDRRVDPYFDEDTDPEIELEKGAPVKGIGVVLDDEIDVTL